MLIYVYIFKLFTVTVFRIISYYDCHTAAVNAYSFVDKYFYILFPSFEIFQLRLNGLFYVPDQTVVARTVSKEPLMKFCEYRNL